MKSKLLVLGLLAGSSLFAGTRVFVGDPLAVIPFENRRQVGFERWYSNSRHKIIDSLARVRP